MIKNLASRLLCGLFVCTTLGFTTAALADGDHGGAVVVNVNIHPYLNVAFSNGAVINLGNVHPHTAGSQSSSLTVYVWANEACVLSCPDTVVLTEASDVGSANINVMADITLSGYPTNDNGSFVSMDLPAGDYLADTFADAIQLSASLNRATITDANHAGNYSGPCVVTLTSQ